MKYKYKIFLIVGAVFLSNSKVQSQDKKIKEILSQLTLEEKAMLVVGTGMKANENSVNGAVGATVGKVNGAAGTTSPIERLKLPPVITADGPAGLRIDAVRKNDVKKYYCTAFPVGTLLASSWDVSLVEKVGKAMGSEVKAYGVDVLLAPGMNIQRNPLGGRNFEYYSEDPLVTGYMGAAMVNGLQANGIGTSIKHFAVNSQETYRTGVNSVVSERALREIYLKGFEIALQKSNPWTVMSSYNKINGEYASESTDLLTGILRDEWGYKGIVMTDWFGGKNTINQVKAGNDLLMPGTVMKKKAVIQAVEDKTLDIKDLDRNVERILSLIVKTPSYKNIRNSNNPDLVNNAQVSRNAAGEGMVLLRNNNVLPLNKTQKIVLFGNNSYDIIAGGTGSGEVNKAYVVNLDQGLLNAGLLLDKTFADKYRMYIETAKKAIPVRTNLLETPKPIASMTFSAEELEDLAADNDIALVTIGRNGGEGHDRKIDFDFNLTKEEKESLSAITTTFHKANKKVVVVLNIDGVIEVASWRDNVDAILLAWQPGLEGGNAIADVLSGKVNPSGKLAITFPVDYSDVPSSKTFPGLSNEKRPEKALYNEGIYVGYRYYDTFKVKPAYEFGYGMSYTTFGYDKIKINSKELKEKLTLSVDVTNLGEKAGKEVVQVYITAPEGELKKPIKELKAFAKTNLLKAGGKETLYFTINASDLASFDSEKSSWITDAGLYTLSIAGSSKDVKKIITFKVPNEIVVKKLSHKLPLKEELEELK